MSTEARVHELLVNLFKKAKTDRNQVLQSVVEEGIDEFIKLGMSRGAVLAMFKNSCRQSGVEFVNDIAEDGHVMTAEELAAMDRTLPLGEPVPNFGSTSS